MKMRSVKKAGELPPLGVSVEFEQRDEQLRGVTIHDGKGAGFRIEAISSYDGVRVVVADPFEEATRWKVTWRLNDSIAAEYYDDYGAAVEARDKVRDEHKVDVVAGPSEVKVRINPQGGVVEEVK